MFSTLFFYLLLFIAAWCYSHIIEYFLHQFLHWIGKQKKIVKVWAGAKFHWDHHRRTRKNNHYDEEYETVLLGGEIYALLILLVAHSVLFVFVPFYIMFPLYAGLCYSSYEYYYIHKKSHMNWYWARKYVPWHYSHHMGLNQNKNWGVRSDVIDKILGTREIYVGTEKERVDLDRRINATQTHTR